MLDRVFGTHIDVLNKSLQKTTQRHQMLTANIANVNTPGYKRRDMDFNLSLAEAEGKRFDPRDTLGNNGGQTRDPSLRSDMNNVDIEKEVMALAETELRYQALTDMTASYFAGLKNVIREGR